MRNLPVIRRFLHNKLYLRSRDSSLAAFFCYVYKKSGDPFLSWRGTKPSAGHICVRDIYVFFAPTALAPSL